MAGVNIPGYEILSELGRGGMGVVYKARQTRLKRLAAVKMILSGPHAGSQARARFLAEAEACARLQHPNIIQIYEIGEVDGNPFFSLEFVDGGSLDSHLKGAPLAPRQAAELIHTLALAVHAAHEKGVVHRDLKPANILLQRKEGGGQPTGEKVEKARALITDYCPKITDFGLAKSIREGDSGRTRDGEVMGTPSYMAPEQGQGRIRDIGPPTDVYALGAILYEFLSGKPPFLAATAMETVMQVINEEPVPLRQLNARLPRDLDTICARCLQKDPRKRYPTAQALAEDLKRFLEGEPITARATPVWERAWRWARRHPTAASLSAVGCLLAIGLVAGLVGFSTHLQQAVTQARQDEQEARAAQQRAIEGQRIAQINLQAQTRLQTGQEAMKAGDARAALLAFSQVLAAIEDEGELQGLRHQTEVLLKEARGRLGEEDARRQAADRLSQLASLRDEALFYSSSFTGLDLAASLRAVQQAARKGLALHGLAGSSGTFTPGPFLDAQRRAEVRESCYELLLLLAEAVAHPLPGSPFALRRRQASEALSLLEQAETLGTTTQALLRRRARYLEQAGRSDEAEELASRIEATPARTALDVFLIADGQLRQGKLREASQGFEQVLRQKPDHFWAQYFLAICQLRQDRPAEARAHLTSCLARRDFLWAYLLRGFASGEMQDFPAAEADYQEAVARKPDSLALYGLHVNRGVMRVRMRNYAGAVEDFQKAITLRPGDFQAYANLAEALQKQGLRDEALVQLDRAVQLQPGMAALYRLRSGLRRDAGERAKALEDLGEAIRAEMRAKLISPAALAADHVATARLHLEAKRYPEAVAACDQALKAVPDHSTAQRWKAEAFLGLKRYPEAIDCFTRYLEHGKPLLEVYRARGLARAKLGQHPEAIEDLTSALRIRPDSDLHAARGWIYIVCQAPKLAHHDFDQAIQRDKHNADAFAGRGYSAALLGRAQDARRDGDRALELGPQTPRLVYNVARIHAHFPAGRDDSQERAVALVQRALSLVPTDQRAGFWKQYVLSDPAMNALRNHPGFQRLRELHDLASPH